MATTTKKAETEVASQTNRVPVRVPRGRPNEDPNVFISVNGVNYLLPRGETSMVPEEVAYEYERMTEAVDAYYDEMEKREREARESAKAAMDY